jgi:hypothetical protein
VGFLLHFAPSRNGNMRPDGPGGVTLGSMPELTTVAVILSAGGARLDLAALNDLPGGNVIKAEIAAGDVAACAAATIRHQVPRAELRAALGRWAAGRGWSVTIAPLHGPD